MENLKNATRVDKTKTPPILGIPQLAVLTGATSAFSAKISQAAAPMILGTNTDQFETIIVINPDGEIFSLEYPITNITANDFTIGGTLSLPDGRVILSVASFGTSTYALLEGSDLSTNYPTFRDLHILTNAPRKISYDSTTNGIAVANQGGDSATVCDENFIACDEYPLITGSKPFEVTPIPGQSRYFVVLAPGVKRIDIYDFNAQPPILLKSFENFQNPSGAVWINNSLYITSRDQNKLGKVTFSDLSNPLTAEYKDVATFNFSPLGGLVAHPTNHDKLIIGGNLVASGQPGQLAIFNSTTEKIESIADLGKGYTLAEGGAVDVDKTTGDIWAVLPFKDIIKAFNSNDLTATGEEKPLSDNTYGFAIAAVPATPLPTDNDGDGYTTDGGDCNDSVSGIHPGAAEICNNVDDNCNAAIDEGATHTYYRDGDGDGYGLNSSTSTACYVPTGYSAIGNDCNDSNSFAYPGASEICNDDDLNCDGIPAVECATTATPANPTETPLPTQTPQPIDHDGDGQTSEQGDCNDLDATIYSGAPERADGQDHNCNFLLSGQLDGKTPWTVNTDPETPVGSYDYQIEVQSGAALISLKQNPGTGEYTISYDVASGASNTNFNFAKNPDAPLASVQEVMNGMPAGWMAGISGTVVEFNTKRSQSTSETNINLVHRAGHNNPEAIFTTANQTLHLTNDGNQGGQADFVNLQVNTQNPSIPVTEVLAYQSSDETPLPTDIPGDDDVTNPSETDTPGDDDVTNPSETNTPGDDDATNPSETDIPGDDDVTATIAPSTPETTATSAPTPTPIAREEEPGCACSQVISENPLTGEINLDVSPLLFAATLLALKFKVKR